jgi:DNA-binding MarR family transcriptional regulator
MDVPDEFADLWFLVRRVAAQMDRSGEALFRDQLGISLPQFLVLSIVDAYPGEIHQQTVADRLGLTKGTVSRQIDLAAAAGLMKVEVSAQSRRKNVVTLTKAGTTLVRRGDALLAKTQAMTVPVFKAADLKTAVRVLRELTQALDEAP